MSNFVQKLKQENKILNSKLSSVIDYLEIWAKECKENGEEINVKIFISQNERMIKYLKEKT